ncbi:MAG: S8 family peptidase [Marinifilaceae bacterium]|jgi:subtilisin family serine protease|nr:S8 family peptidase [Marinifilaceae bacterium]
MNLIKKISIYSCFSIFCANGLSAQCGISNNQSTDYKNSKYLNWCIKDPQNTEFQGVSVNKLYKSFLKNQKATKEIIVAVIDSGVDIEHEDLVGKIWQNQDEIADNGIDDDNNGYIDDINGWNFLGNTKGEILEFENLEYVRIFKSLSQKYDTITSEEELAYKDRKDYYLFRELQTKYYKELTEKNERAKEIEELELRFNIIEKLLETELKDKDLNYSNVKNLNSKSAFINNAKNAYLSFHDAGVTKKDLIKLKDNNSNYINKFLNINYNPREIIGDNPSDLSQRNYGNPNVIGSGADHGTFVAGIIAANRNNNIGIDGICDNVKLMCLRVVPGGDERDKDVALAVRYAVDNGARIINMSFGKYHSPQKEMVDDAIKYAEQKGVLIIHAAGNDGINIDRNAHYPDPQYLNKGKANNIITVGASGPNLDKNVAGDFSNYGKNKVDIFAPGVKILSLNVDDKYEIADGTSYSAPVVSGIAALLWSHFPDLKYMDIKNAILNSSNKLELKVLKPGEKSKMVKFNKLCTSGGIVNAYNAFEYLKTNNI